MELALANPNITKVTLGADIAGDFTIERSIEIDLAGNNISGTLNFTHNDSVASEISNSGLAATVNTVNINTKNASFTQGAGVTVTNLNLIDVKPATYTNEGTVGTVTITDADARFLNNGTTNNVVVDTTGTVILGGGNPITKVLVSQAATVTVEQNSIVTTLEVNAVATVQGSGTVGTVSGTTAPTVGSDITVENNTSTATTVNVSNESQLQAALENATVTTITLAKDLTVTSAVELSREVTLNGNNKILTVKGAAKANAISGLGILADNVTVEDLTVKLATDAPLAAGTYEPLVQLWNDNLVEIYNASNITLKNVSVDGSEKAQNGIYVNNDAKDLTVNFNNISTTRNHWAGVGINAKTGTTVTTTFTNVTGADFAETTPAVYTEGAGTRTVNGLNVAGLTNTAAGTVKPGFPSDAGKTAQEWWTKQ